jgi:hypothetical protein
LCYKVKRNIKIMKILKSIGKSSENNDLERLYTIEIRT